MGPAAAPVPGLPQIAGSADAGQPGAVTRQQLEFALWGDEPPDGDLLRSHVYELRRSVDGPFAKKLIHTLPRVGYRLAVSSTSDAGKDDDEGA